MSKCIVWKDTIGSAKVDGQHYSCICICNCTADALCTQYVPILKNKKYVNWITARHLHSVCSGAADGTQLVLQSFPLPGRTKTSSVDWRNRVNLYSM